MLILTNATQLRFAHVLNDDIVNTIRQPDAELMVVHVNGKTEYGVFAATDDVDCIPGLKYFNKIPKALYTSIYRKTYGKN